MFLGLRTVIYKVGDLARAKGWYRKALGIDPYFDEPFYVGFNIGGYELGLDPDTPRGAPGAPGTPGAGGALAYWGVENVETALAHLVTVGAEPHAAVQDVGGGIRVASVRDPFGNLFGIIENPNFRLPGQAG